MTARVTLVSLLVVSGCTGAEDALRPVAEPPQVEAVDRNPDPGIVEVELTATVGTTTLDGVDVPIWGYADGDGLPTMPGPMIVAEPGDLLVVHFYNQLEDGTTLHFHGPRLPNEMDGAPVGGAIVAPGESFDYVFPLEDAGTFWYHPHWDTARQLERGLYGQLVVREPAVAGANERFFLLDDVDRDDSGHIVVEATEDDRRFGRRGDTMLVNGAVSPVLDLSSNALERWHLTNASNGRYFALRIPEHTFTVIGTDGGLLGESYDTKRLVMTPGSRFDVVVSITGAPGDTIDVMTEPVDRGPSSPNDVSHRLMTLRLGAAGSSPPDGWKGSLPRRQIAPIDVSGAKARELRLGAAERPDAVSFYINAESWPFAEPEQGVVGDVEVWSVVNDTATSEPFHLHGTFVQPLDLDGTAWPHLSLEDVVDIPSGSTVRLAVPLEREGNWMFHSHILEHAELGMMRVLRLVR